MKEEEDALVREIRKRYEANPEYLDYLAKTIEERSGEPVSVEELKAEYGLT